MAICSRASVAGDCCCVMRGGNGLQGVNGHRAADGGALRRGLPVGLAETGHPSQMAPVRWSPDVMGRAGGSDVVGTTCPLCWCLERLEVADPPSPPDPH